MNGTATGPRSGQEGGCPAQQPGILDTLAAAYAELGDDEAVAAQQQALAKIPAENVEMKDDFERRLRHYERSQPWRE